MLVVILFFKKIEMPSLSVFLEEIIEPSMPFKAILNLICYSL